MIPCLHQRPDHIDVSVSYLGFLSDHERQSDTLRQRPVSISFLLFALKAQRLIILVLFLFFCLIPAAVICLLFS